MNSSANQQNTANRGGASSIATPANSGTSGIFGGTSLGASHGNKDAGSGGKASMDGARRSSQESNKFGNLSNLKRNSGDATASARRTSLNDQAVKPGFIGSVWQKYTKGGE